MKTILIVVAILLLGAYAYLKYHKKKTVTDTNTGFQNSTTGNMHGIANMPATNFGATNYKTAPADNVGLK